jgi:transitional endoplasmic reticulum ATPase
MARRKLQFVPLGDTERFKDLNVLYSDGKTALRQLLAEAPALCLEPLGAEELDQTLDRFSVGCVVASPTLPLYLPPISTDHTASPRAPEPSRTAPPSPLPVAAQAPETLRDEDAVTLAYGQEIENVASFLHAELSVLVLCDKLVVEHLWRRTVQKAKLRPVILEVPEDEAGGLVPRSLRQRQLEAFKSLTRALKHGDVLVVPHLDLLAGGADSSLPGEAREIIEILYNSSDRLMLAFADRGLAISEVLAARFAVRFEISGVPQEVARPDGSRMPTGEALTTRAEREHFVGFDAGALYKNIAGMNPVRLRQAFRYAVKERPAGRDVAELYAAIRAFKAQTSSHFEVPDVSFEDIGGYERVKAEIGRALRLIAGSFEGLPLKMQRELIPRGFIFHGPPGTGKTLFAKAIANLLNATIQVVSGPEITDMYVGESERKVRELFAEARRNAPAVLVFDEFDSIAAERSGRNDGGSRAGNAIVTQILTEMDGFRPDVPMLVIGTTNRIDMIDPALLRPSRFQAIAIELPDTVARRAIAAVHGRHFGVPISEALLDVVGAATSGFNGDEIRSIFRDALVGMKCENPPIPADARRLGQLIGRLRLAGEQRASQASRRREAASLRPGERLRPQGPMIQLTEAAPSATPSPVPAGDQVPARGGQSDVLA